MSERVDLLVGHTCNNRCIHCFMEDTRFDLKLKKLPLDKTFSQLKKSIKKYSEKGYKNITFTGGEVTIRSDFFDLARFVKERKMKIAIQSNGRAFADKTFSEKIMDIEPSLSVTIPLHSTEETVHDRITRVDGSFKQTITGIRNIVELECKNITIKTVIHKLNYTDVENIAKFAKELGAIQYTISTPQMNGNHHINWKNMAVDHTKSAHYIKKAIDSSRNTGLKVSYDAIPFCFMEGYEKYNSDIETSIIPNIKGDNNIRESDTKENILYDLEVGRRTKVNICKQCKYFNVCMGVWKEYPKILGVFEFRPVKGKRITSAKEFAEKIGVIN